MVIAESHFALLLCFCNVEASTLQAAKTMAVAEKVLNHKRASRLQVKVDAGSPMFNGLKICSTTEKTTIGISASTNLAGKMMHKTSHDTTEQK